MGKAALLSKWWYEDLSMENHTDNQVKYRKICSNPADGQELDRGQGEAENWKEVKW